MKKDKLSSKVKAEVEMTSSPKLSKKIIRGANVEGIIFCTPTGDLELEQRRQSQEQEHLKTLEDFWLDKGFQMGLERGFEEGWRKGEIEGFQKGMNEGQQVGRDNSKEEFELQGFERGKTAIKEELLSTFSELDTLCREIVAEKERLIENTKNHLIDFSLEICSKILRQRLQDPDVLSQIIRDLISEYQSTLKDQNVTIILPEQHLESVKSQLTLYLGKGKLGEASFIFQQDRSLEEGDFRIETPQGIIHYNLERQIQEIKQFNSEIQHS